MGQRVLRRMWKRVPFCVLIEGESWERMMLLRGKITRTCAAVIQDLQYQLKSGKNVWSLKPGRMFRQRRTSDSRR